MGYYRAVSPGERVFFLPKETGRWARKFGQVIIEGEGRLDVHRWRAALATLSACHPCARLVLRGHLGFSRWDNSGPEPAVSEVFADWDGVDFERAPFLWRAPVDLRTGPLGEVVLIQGTPPRVLMRVHHAVMDGMGAVTFVQDLFRVLRGERPRGANSTKSEIDIWRAADFGSGKMPPAPMDAMVPFEPRDGDPDARFAWNRLRVPGPVPRLVPELAVGIAEHARSARHGTVRIALFIDLRRHLPDGEITLANCTSMILCDVAPDDTARTVTVKMAGKLRDRTYLDMSRHIGIARWLPAALFKASPRAIRRMYQTGLFRASAFITHIGHFMPELYSYPGFRATGVIPMPTCDATTPLHVVICEGVDSVEIVTAAPAPLGGDGRLDRLARGLQARLTRAHVDPAASRRQAGPLRDAGALARS